MKEKNNEKDDFYSNDVRDHGDGYHPTNGGRRAANFGFGPE
jgi:hypothetical protein